MSFSCRACGSTALKWLYETAPVPIHCGLIVPTFEEAAAYPTGEIRLAFCRNCGLISNVAFCSDLLSYSGDYNETQAFSPTFTVFQQDLVQRLIARFDLRHTDVLEIGCGRGEFLALLCKAGSNHGIGFDPSGAIGEVRPAGCDIRFVRDFYSQRYSDCQASFVCCNMTLEHIAFPAAFLDLARLAMRPASITFFLLPDAARILKEAAFWDVYYEHCNYFTEASLRRLFVSCGFDVISIEKEYEGQYLAIAARLAADRNTPAAGPLDALAAEADSFSNRCGEKIAYWRQFISARSGRVVVWGGGSKAVAFLTSLGVEKDIRYVVDINPRRQNTWLAGSAQEIVAPEFLREYSPDTVIVMNPIYRDEIKASLSSLGLAPTIVACQ